jgi:hypothetical protein
MIGGRRPRLFRGEERSGRVSLDVTLGDGKLENRAQIKAKMRDDTAGVRHCLRIEERLKSLKGEIGEPSIL